jgi:hypothetical protein
MLMKTGCCLSATLAIYRSDFKEVSILFGYFRNVQNRLMETSGANAYYASGEVTNSLGAVAKL